MVAESFNLEDILKIENVSSKQIVSLVLDASSTVNTEDNINIYFANKYSEKVDEDYPIKYKVRGTERDWVMVSSSLIEDRLNKITSSDYFLNLSRSFILGIISLVMFGTMFSLLATSENIGDINTQKVVANLEKKYKNKENIDIISAIIEIEKVNYLVNQKLNIQQK